MLILRQPVTHYFESGTTIMSVFLTSVTAFWSLVWGLHREFPILGGHSSRMPGLQMSLALNSYRHWVLVSHSLGKEQSSN